MTEFLCSPSQSNSVKSQPVSQTMHKRKCDNQEENLPLQSVARIYHDPSLGMSVFKLYFHPNMYFTESVRIIKRLLKNRYGVITLWKLSLQILITEGCKFKWASIQEKQNVYSSSLFVQFEIVRMGKWIFSFQIFYKIFETCMNFSKHFINHSISGDIASSRINIRNSYHLHYKHKETVQD